MEEDGEGVNEEEEDKFSHHQSNIFQKKFFLFKYNKLSN